MQNTATVLEKETRSALYNLDVVMPAWNSWGENYDKAWQTLSELSGKVSNLWHVKRTSAELLREKRGI